MPPVLAQFRSASLPVLRLPWCGSGPPQLRIPLSQAQLGHFWFALAIPIRNALYEQGLVCACLGRFAARAPVLVLPVMDALFWQIVITVWLHGHAVTWTLPKLYYATDAQACFARVDELAARVKRGRRVLVSCEQTNRREI